ncbi:hypothetical protein IE980_08540 [Klebsiella pneumoniae]|uniref:Uncharacterized protein n=1 Tax=Klebsiella pneumoniae TaxID=573 RepID=A0A927E333_KLEPN|nr:hypothetical protein [Klebsiella pneumoniae]
MKEVVTYRHFMNASGGGVTASGGEAILQAEFVRDWFRACKKEGIHTCLGYQRLRTSLRSGYRRAAGGNRLVMLDLKQMNDEIHQNRSASLTIVRWNSPSIWRRRISMSGSATWWFPAGQTMMIPRTAWANLPAIWAMSKKSSCCPTMSWVNTNG